MLLTAEYFQFNEKEKELFFYFLCILELRSNVNLSFNFFLKWKKNNYEKIIFQV